MTRVCGIFVKLLTTALVFDAINAQPHPNSGNVGGLELHLHSLVYLFSDHADTAYNAFLYCQRYGGSLSSISSADEERFYRQTAAITGAREFWLSYMRIGTEDLLRSWGSDPNFFVDCQNATNAAFCRNNTSGPHLHQPTFERSCLANNSCPGGMLSTNAFVKWADGEPNANKSCTLIKFDNCTVKDGCLYSSLSTKHCYQRRHFICMKYSCPDASTAPISLESTESFDDFATYFGVHLSCETTAATITVNHCARKRIDVQVARVGLPHDMCYISDQHQVLTVRPLTECGGIGKDMNGTLMYHYTLQLEAFFGTSTSVVKRFRTFCTQLKCNVVNEFHNLTPNNSNQEVDPFRRTLFFRQEDERGSFTTAMFVFDDVSFSVPTANLSVNVPDPVYAGVILQSDVRDKFNVRLLDCSVIGSGLCPCSRSRHELLRGGCPVDPTFQIHGQLDFLAKFSFSSFLFTRFPQDEVEQVQILCYVEVCDRSYEGCAQPTNCTSRKKRSLPPRQGVIVHEVRSDVITIHPKRSCDLENGGCSNLCSEVDGLAVCACPDHLQLDVDGKTCLYRLEDSDEDENEFLYIDNEEEEEDEFEAVTAVLLVVSAIMSALSAFWIRGAESKP